MSWVKFYPIKWWLNLDWSQVSVIGRTSSGNPIRVNLDYYPTILMIYPTGQANELPIFQNNGFIECFKCLEQVCLVSFINRFYLESFIRDYSGPAKIRQVDQLRMFFWSKALDPGKWQEVTNIYSRPEDRDNTFDFHAQQIQSFSGPSPLVLNAFLVKSDKISITYQDSQNKRTLTFDNWSDLIQSVSDSQPDRLIYYPNIPPGLSVPSSINWQSLSQTIPDNSLSLAEHWSVINGDKMLDNLASFWKIDPAQHLNTGIMSEGRDVISLLDPNVEPRMVEVKRTGQFNNFGLIPMDKLIEASSVSPGLKSAFHGTTYQSILFRWGIVNLPKDTLWIGEDSIAVESGNLPLAIIRGPDRLWVDQNRKLTREGYGLLSNPPFNLLNKYVINLILAKINSIPIGSISPIQSNRDDFVITTNLTNCSSSPLIKQLQELGKLPVRFRLKVKYVQTINGPVLMELVDNDPDSYFKILDLNYYDRIISSVIADIL